MGVRKFIRVHILEPIFGADNAAKAVDFAVTEVQAAVAQLKTTEIGATVAKLVQDVEAKTNPDGSKMTGAQKFASVLADATPLVVDFLTNKGAAGAAVSAVEDIARELIQSTYNDAQATTVGTLAKQILAIFGVKL